MAGDLRAHVDWRIKLNDSDSISQWSDRLGVSSDELLSAIQRVGTWAPAVERLLYPHGRTARGEALASKVHRTVGR